MAIRVQLPNGEIGEFPDDMPHEEIESVLQKQFPPEQKSEIASAPFNEQEQPEERIDSKSLMSDLVHGLGKALRQGTDFAVKTPGMIKSLTKHLEENPLSALKHDAGQLLAGTAETGKDLANTGLSIGSMALKHLDPLSAALMKKNGKSIEAPQIPENTGVEKFLGLEPTQKEDRLIRAVPEIAGGLSAAKSVVKTIAKAAKAPSKKALFKQALEDKISAAEKDLSLSKGDLDSLKTSLRKEYSKVHNERVGELSPVGQEESINVKQGKLDKLKASTEIPEQKIGEIPPEPDTKAIINEKKEALDKARSEADKALGTLDNPRLKGGAKIKKAIEDVKSSASDLYKSARAHYVDQKIVADNGEEIKAVTKDLTALKDSDELAAGYGSGTAEQKALESQLDALKGEKVNASDIFDLQRTLEKMAEETRKKQYSGVNDLEFKRLNGVADRLESHAGTLEKRLESVGGKEVQSMIKEANKGWKTFKDLSKRNPVGKAALKGELPTRAMIEIAKDHPGNDFLHALVESDPELKKYMLASYAGESNVNKLLKPTTLTQKYIQSLPEVEEHVNSLKQALQGVKEGEVKASRIKKEYDDLVKSMKDAANEQKVRQDAIKESDILKKQIAAHQANIPKLESKIKAMEQKGENVAKLKDELKQHERDVKNKGGRLKELAAFFVKVKGANMLHL